MPTSATASTATYTVATALGLRQSEALGLRWPDLDFDAGTLTVRRKLYRRGGEWYEGRPKSDAGTRTITVPPEVIEIVREHRIRQVEEQLVAGPLWEGRDLVFCDELGRPMHSSTVTKRLARLLAAHGLPRKRFHDLRHTSATLMLVMGVPLEVIQKTLGHADSRTTLIYAHVMPELQREAAAKMGAFLRGASTAP